MLDIVSKLEAIKLYFPVMLLIGIIVVAIVERIKAETPKLPSYCYTLISMAIGAGLFAVFVYAPVIVIAFVFVGLIGSGIFDITSYVGTKKVI